MTRFKAAFSAWATLLIALATIALGGCSGARLDTQTPIALQVEEMRSLLPPLPPRDEPRSSSAPVTRMIEGNETHRRGGDCEDVDTDVILQSPPDGTAWVVYRLYTEGRDIIEVVPRILLEEEESSAYLALSDYEQQAWRIIPQPIPGSGAWPVFVPDWAVNDSDFYYLAVLTCLGDSARVDKVSHNFEEPDWTTYDLTWSELSGNGVDLIVQDERPMIAYSNPSANAVFFARGTCAIPNAPSQWVQMTAAAGAEFPMASTPLAITSVAGKPAIAFTEREEWKVCYAWADQAEPDVREDWTVTTIFDADEPDIISDQIGAAECLGTPRVAFNTGSGPGYLASAMTSQPTDLDWSVTHISDVEDEPSRFSLTTIEGKPVIGMISSIGGGRGLHAGYAASHTPPTPADWNIVPVHNWSEAGGKSSIASQLIGEDQRPVFSYVSGLWNGQLHLARPLIDEPVTDGDWLRCILDGRADCTDLAVLNDRPLVIFRNSDENSIKIARAITPEFEDATDFDIITIQEDVTSGPSVSIAVVGSSILICYYDGEAQLLKFGYLWQ